MNEQEIKLRIAKASCRACEFYDTKVNEDCSYGEWDCIENHDTPCRIATEVASEIYDTILAPLVAENERLKEDCEEKERQRVENCDDYLKMKHKYEVEHKALVNLVVKIENRNREYDAYCVEPFPTALSRSYELVSANDEVIKSRIEQLRKQAEEEQR